MPTLFSILGVALSLASTSYSFQLPITVGGDSQTQRESNVLPVLNKKRQLHWSNITITYFF